jgi:predicted dehydrogenase
MPKNVRVGVIGTGFGKTVAAPAYQATDGFTLVDLVSARDAAAVRSLCRRDDVDLISVHSPPFLHLQHVREALESGHPVLCDKPFGLNAAEAEEMVELADRTGLMGFVNYEFRHHALRQRLRAMIQGGELGHVELLRWSADFAFWRASAGRPYGWIFDAERGGGWVGVWGSHIIDFLVWTFGDMAEVHGVLRNVVSERIDSDGHTRPCTAETGFAATLRTAGGTTLVLDSTATAEVDRISSVTVIAERGTIDMKWDNLWESGGWLEQETRDASAEIFRAEHEGNPHLLLMGRVAERIRDSLERGALEPDLATFADGVACARVMDRLREPPAPARNPAASEPGPVSLIGAQGS